MKAPYFQPGKGQGKKAKKPEKGGFPFPPKKPRKAMHPKSRA